MNCYIDNPFNKSVLPEGVNKDNTLFYPEAGMTTNQQLNTGRPKDFHIITDSHFLVPLYDKRDVYFWNGKEWENPDFQTFGTSYSLILSELWDGEYSIPRAVVDGKITNVMGSKV